MTSKREELIHDLFERWNAGVREIDREAIDPQAVLHSAMTNSTYQGYDEIRRWMDEIDEQFERWELSVEESRELSDGSLLLLGQVNFRGRASGVEFDQPIGWLLRFSGERVSEMRNFPDHQRALDAAGTD
ncbi:MAG: nuclear transport factor 2 family protein [Actinomycetota bacterium]